MSSKTDIDLSVVVRVVGGGDYLRRCLGRLQPQVQDRPIEVLVPYDASVAGIAEIKQTFPQFIFVSMEAGANDAIDDRHTSHDLLDRRSAAGFHAARGRILAHLEDYATPDPDWCSEVIEAHRLPYGVIGGAVEHEGRGLLNWAVYLLDFSRYALPLSEGPTDYLTDVNIAYKREALQSVDALWREQYNEATINWALARRGVVLWRRPQMVVRQDRGRLAWRDLVAERYAWGRLFGQVRSRDVSLSRRTIYLIGSPILPLLRLWRIATKTFGGRRNRTSFLLSIPHIIVMATAWSLGEFTGYAGG
jgi:hypothetical protein